MKFGHLAALPRPSRGPPAALPRPSRGPLAASQSRCLKLGASCCRPVSSRSVHHGIFPDVYFYTTLQRPHERRPMASRREQVSALFFRSLNTTSSHRMFSMGYRRAKSTQRNTNFQKRIFLANNFGITTRGP